MTRTGARRLGRNTPTSAGRTTPGRNGPCTAPEHPHVGGEDWSRHRIEKVPNGTPPRRRGGRTPTPCTECRCRNTPTSAGRTRPTRGRRAASTEHPHVGGEDAARSGWRNAVRGTPPRRRGGRTRQRRPTSYRRNTPTSAGRTTRAGTAAAGSAEHPHVGGEDDTATSTTARSCGTPPRRRGGLPGPLRVPHRDRNTPTSAGRTSAASSGAGRSTEHPHVGGEDMTVGVFNQTDGGTPPRRRGGRRSLVGGDLSVRNTPTSAGRTRARCLSRSASAEHPHVGGEDVRQRLFGLAADGTPPRRRGGRAGAEGPPPRTRNTPTSAGRTPGQGPRSSGQAEHPHVGGEDFFGSPMFRPNHGTPPRRRGGPWSRRSWRPKGRNTPTSAGRTLSDLALMRPFAFPLPSWALSAAGSWVARRHLTETG